MPSVTFTATLRRHLEAPPSEVAGATVRDALEATFRRNPRLRGYVLDDQGHLRPNVVIFIDGQRCSDRVELSETLQPDSTVHVLQALSGG